MKTIFIKDPDNDYEGFEVIAEKDYDGNFIPKITEVDYKGEIYFVRNNVYNLDNDTQEVHLRHLIKD